MPNKPAGTVADVPCPFCGCVCDDIVLRVEADRIVEVQRACPTAEDRFRNYDHAAAAGRPPCLVDGRVAETEQGVQRAAEILTRARYPVIYGLHDTTCEAQQAAAAVTDWIGGVIDTPTGTRLGASGMAFQDVGQVTATLGELGRRADLVIFWGGLPDDREAASSIRHLLRRLGLLGQNGGQSAASSPPNRRLAAVGVGRIGLAEEADVVVSVAAGSDAEALWTLRALAAGIDVDASVVEQRTGVPLGSWQALMHRMKQARYGALLWHTPPAEGPPAYLVAEAVHRLAAEMNRHTRFVCRALDVEANAAGAENVLCWRTGFPLGVEFARGYPRFNPGEYTAANILARGEADAALLVGPRTVGSLPLAARQHLQTIPVIALEPAAAPGESLAAAAVTFATSTPGVDSPGTIYRLDGVPFRLRPVFKSPLPSYEALLRAIEREVRRKKFGDPHPGR